MKLRKNNPYLEIMGDAPIEFHALGPVNYQAAGLLTYAVSEEFVQRALDNPDVVGVVTTQEIATTPRAYLNRPRFDGWIVSDDSAADFFRFHNWLALETKFYSLQFKPDYRYNDWPDVHMATVISPGCEIMCGAVIGYPGARFIYAKDGERIDVVHVGGVHISEGAHIGANAVIVQSVWPRPTLIGKNAFIGNLVNVGHNAQVEDNAVVLSGAILGGSCVIGEGATVDIGAVIRPHVTVGPGAYVSMGSVVTRDVPAGQRVTGNWAVEHSRFVRRVKRWGDS